MDALYKEARDPSSTRRFALWSMMGLETSLLNRRWCGVDDILVVDLRPRTPPPRRCSLAATRSTRGCLGAGADSDLGWRQLKDDGFVVEDWLVGFPPLMLSRGGVRSEVWLHL